MICVLSLSMTGFLQVSRDPDSSAFSYRSIRTMTIIAQYIRECNRRLRVPLELML